MPNPGFSPDQRQELQEVGLLPAQVDELEATALPRMRLILRPLPANNDVRGELSKVAKTLRRAEAEIVRLLSTSRLEAAKAQEVLAVEEASVRIMVTESEAGNGGQVLDRALAPIRAALQVVECAMSDFPRRPTRQRAASAPVQSIDQALLAGFLRAHGHKPGEGCVESNAPLPAYTIRRSYFVGSAYRRIVEICFEAAGLGATSRERAIRDFMKSARRRSENVGTSDGRNAAPEPDVPS